MVQCRATHKPNIIVLTSTLEHLCSQDLLLCYYSLIETVHNVQPFRIYVKETEIQIICVMLVEPKCIHYFNSKNA